MEDTKGTIVGGGPKIKKFTVPRIIGSSVVEVKVPPFISMRMMYGGNFESRNNVVYWSGGSILLEGDVSTKKFNMNFLHQFVMDKFKVKYGEYKIWYRRFGENFDTGRKVMTDESDVEEVLRTLDKVDMVSLYVVFEVDKWEKLKVGPMESNSSILVGSGEGGNVNRSALSSEEIPPPKNPPIHPLTQAVQTKKGSASTNPKCKVPKHELRPKLPIRRAVQRCTSSAATSTPTDDLSAVVITEKEYLSCLEAGDAEAIASTPGENYREAVTHGEKKAEASPVGSKKGKETLVSKNEVNATANPDSSKRKSKEKKKRKAKRKNKSDVDAGFVITSEDEERSESDAPLQEEDIEEQIDEDLFAEGLKSDILEGINQSLQESLAPKRDTRSSANVAQDLEEGLNLADEKEYDSEDPDNIHGSDEEVDNSPVFNAETDFNHPIKLRLGLKFASAEIFRKALRQHAVENKYDYYYLHNGKKLVTAYCKERCKCPWDPKRSKRKACTCGKVICNFKVLGKKKRLEETFHITRMRIKHNCRIDERSRKVTAQYLAEKYLEDWRSDPNWHLTKGFGQRVLRETGVFCNYYKLWYARSRAKLMLYGDGLEQYKSVWDYVAAILKYNEGSMAVCACDNIERPPPIFQRMFICLKPVLDGFMGGCRPLIGLDGCHLTGAYPGICLVAVASDGNNNIYPLAWGVVEIEKTDSWIWFIDLLASSLGTVDGAGYTFMSDRQKGLLQAFSSVVPKAEVRFCWRHIWANFKLKWNGVAYKDLLWDAAKATTKMDFDKHMLTLKGMSVAAHKYMDAIPPQCWSRHAFSTTSKSNMLLNNMCESFNNVLNQARDKPILTHMEWMRRYVMQRNCEKREGVHSITGRFMPYVRKQFVLAERLRKYNIVTRSTEKLFEVENNSDRFLVDLEAHTCSCYRWQLTGIPCHHSYACIMYMRSDPEDYVDDFYSKTRYMAAYDPVIPPMPGPKQWEKTPYPEPLPPPFKKMPGRPSKNKRRKQAGEDAEKATEAAQAQLRLGGKPRRCSKCKQFGHNIKTCKNEYAEPPPPEPKSKGGRPFSQDPYVILDREKRAKGKGKGKAKAKNHQQEQQQAYLEQCTDDPMVDISSQASTITSAALSKQHTSLV